MSNANQLHYFVSQTYRQVQISVEKGTQSYSYGDYSAQFDKLLEAQSDEAYTRLLSIELVEEAAKYKQTTDYLRQEMSFEAQPLTVADRETAIALDPAGQDATLTERRLNRRTNPTNHPVAELI